MVLCDKIRGIAIVVLVKIGKSFASFSEHLRWKFAHGA